MLIAHSSALFRTRRSMIDACYVLLWNVSFISAVTRRTKTTSLALARTPSASASTAIPVLKAQADIAGYSPRSHSSLPHISGLACFTYIISLQVIFFGFHPRCRVWITDFDPIRICRLWEPHGMYQTSASVSTLMQVTELKYGSY